jgi:urease accessory protein
MLIEKVLRHISEYPPDLKVETVNFSWWERDKKIMKKLSSAGEEIGLRLGEALSDGDVLFADATRIVVAVLESAELITVNVTSRREMGEVCFALGNRHLPISIGEEQVCVPYDAPTLAYLTKLGFDCARIRDKFTDFHELKAHEHGHEPSPAGTHKFKAPHTPHHTHSYTPQSPGSYRPEPRLDGVEEALPAEQET